MSLELELEVCRKYLNKVGSRLAYMPTHKLEELLEASHGQLQDPEVFQEIIGVLRKLSDKVVAARTKQGIGDDRSTVNSIGMTSWMVAFGQGSAQEGTEVAFESLQDREVYIKGG